MLKAQKNEGIAAQTLTKQRNKINFSKKAKNMWKNW